MKLLLYPDGNHSKWDITVLKHYVTNAGIEIVTQIDESFDRVMFWSYHKTFLSPDNTILKLMDNYPVINIGCLDVTKSKVEDVMMRSFGYNCLVDPKTTKFFGEKSEVQGKHSLIEKTKFDGYKKGCIYVRVLDGRINPTTFRHFRIFIFGSKISLVYTIDKPYEHRHSGIAESVINIYKDPSELFSQEETANIIRFCELYPVQFTELDAIRDSDGKLYIIDNNNVSAISDKGKALLYANDGKLMRYLSNEFLQFLESWR